VGTFRMGSLISIQHLEVRNDTDGQGMHEE
jgi:hypothetical protein